MITPRFIGEYLKKQYRRSILILNLLPDNRGIADQRFSVKILAVHINGGDLVIVIRRVVINPLVGIAAGRVKRDLEFPFAYVAAAALLIHRAEDMEKLAHALFLGISRNGVHFHKGDSDESGLRRQIPGESERAHTSAVTA